MVNKISDAEFEKLINSKQGIKTAKESFAKNGLKLIDLKDKSNEK